MVKDPMPEQNALKEAVTPWEACTGAGSQKKLWTHWESKKHTGAGLLAGTVTQPQDTGAVCSSRTVSCGEDPRWSNSCSLWEVLTLEKLMEDCLVGERPHTGAEEEYEESSS